MVGPPDFSHGAHPRAEQQLRIMFGAGNEMALRATSRSVYTVLRCHVAEHPLCPDDVRAVLAEDPVDRVCWAAVQRMGSPPPAVFGRLAASENGMVRFELALSARCPPGVLGLLAGDRLLDVRRAVAGNENTPPEVLVRLGRERSYQVANALVSNPNTPGVVLQRLLRFRQPDVRRMAAAHRNLPAATRAMWELTQR